MASVSGSTTTLPLAETKTSASALLPLSNGLNWPTQFPQDLEEKIFSFLSREEREGLVPRVNSKWRALRSQIVKSRGYHAALKLQKLREHFAQGSLAERLLRTDTIDDGIFTVHCWETFMERLCIEPPLTPPSQIQAIGFIGPETLSDYLSVAMEYRLEEKREERMPLLTLEQYIANTLEQLPRIMERPETILPYFYGPKTILREDFPHRRIPVNREKASEAWQNLLFKAKAARFYLTSFDAESEGIDSYAFQVLSDFVIAANAFDEFLADFILVHKLTRSLLSDTSRSERDLRDLQLPAMDWLLSLECQSLALSIHYIMSRKQHITRLSSCSLIVLADFRAPYQVLLAFPVSSRLKDCLGHFSLEEIVLLITQLRPGNTLSSFGKYFYWYAITNTTIAALVTSIPTQTLLWLIEEFALHAQFLRLPAVVDKLNDAQIIRLMNSSENLKFSFSISPGFYSKLMERMTPEICIAVMKADIGYMERIFSTPTLMERFNREQLFSVLKTRCALVFLAFVKHSAQCLVKLSLEQCRHLLNTYSTILISEAETQKARAFMQYYILTRTDPVRANQLSFLSEDPLNCLESPDLRKRVSDVYLPSEQGSMKWIRTLLYLSAVSLCLYLLVASVGADLISGAFIGMSLELSPVVFIVSLILLLVLLYYLDWIYCVEPKLPDLQPSVSRVSSTSLQAPALAPLPIVNLAANEVQQFSIRPAQGLLL